MHARHQNQWLPWLVAVVLGVVAGLALWFGIFGPSPGRVARDGRDTVERLGEARSGDSLSSAREASLPEDNAAVQYAVALRERDVATVVERTLWMRERLERVAAETGHEDAVAQERARLYKSLTTWRIEENQLRAEGVDDKYLFAPEVRIEYIGTDDGELDLAEPIAQRTWLRVIYPKRSRALRDELGRPIRSVVAGINVTASGYVLKAGVLGNAEIAFDSVLLDWPVP